MVIQQKMEEEDIISLHQAFEKARPRSVKGDLLISSLNALYEETLKNFEKLIRRPDGSRIYQLLFRRGNKELRDKLLKQLEPYFFEISTKIYSNYIMKTIIKKGNADNRAFVFNRLKGKFDVMLGHTIGKNIVELIYEKATIQQKNQMMMDFFGDEWKKSKKVLTFEEICNINEKKKKLATEALFKNVKKAIEKQAGNLRVTQKLMVLLGKDCPERLNEFTTDFKQFAFTFEGSQAAIMMFMNANQKDIRIALKLIEDVPRVDVITGKVNVEDGNQAEEEQLEFEEEEEEEEAAEENQEEEAALVPSTKTGTLAVDGFGWRVLACAISHLDCNDNDNFKVIQEEIVPSLLQDWEFIRESTPGLRLMVRLITSVPSVFQGINYMKDTVNDKLKELIISTFLQHVIDDVEILGKTADGSLFASKILEYLKEKDNKSFQNLLNSIITENHITDKVLHKMVRKAIQVIGGAAAEKATEIIKSYGISKVLETPGAWVIFELNLNNKSLEKEVVEIIKKGKFNGKAIEKILNPESAFVKKPQKNGKKNGKKNH